MGTEEFAARLRRYQTARGLSMNKLAKTSGVSRGYLTDLEGPEGGGRPGADIVRKLEAALWLAPGALLGTVEDGMRPLPNLDAARSHTTATVEPMWETVLVQSSQKLVGRALYIQMVPIADQAVPASALGHVDVEYLPVPVDAPRNLLAVPVVGDCMLPKIAPGDLVIIDRDMEARERHVVLIQIGDEWSLKRLVGHNDGRWLFQPDNPLFQPLDVAGAEVVIIGVVISVQKGPP